MDELYASMTAPRHFRRALTAQDEIKPQMQVCKVEGSACVEGTTPVRDGGRFCVSSILGILLTCSFREKSLVSEREEMVICMVGYIWSNFISARLNCNTITIDNDFVL